MNGISDYLSFWWKKKWIVVTGTLLATVLGATSLKTEVPQSPMLEAQVKVLIRIPERIILNYGIESTEALMGGADQLLVLVRSPYFKDAMKKINPDLMPHVGDIHVTHVLAVTPKSFVIELAIRTTAPKEQSSKVVDLVLEALNLFHDPMFKESMEVGSARIRFNNEILREIRKRNGEMENYGIQLVRSNEFITKFLRENSAFTLWQPEKFPVSVWVEPAAVPVKSVGIFSKLLMSMVSGLAGSLLLVTVWGYLSFAGFKVRSSAG